MPRRPKGVAVAGGGGDGDLEAAVGTGDEEEEKVAVFSVSGMTCAACAGSVEKAVKRLPGIHDAAVDVLWGRAQVVFCPAFVSVSSVDLGEFYLCFLMYKKMQSSRLTRFFIYEETLLVVAVCKSVAGLSPMGIWAALSPLQPADVGIVVHLETFAIGSSMRSLLQNGYGKMLTLEK
jgi:copper chaperone CopZ